MKLSTPDGASVAPTPESSQPVSATGQTVGGGDAAYTVVPGVYALTACVGYVLGGWSTTAAAANILFACPFRQTILINVPIGTTSLYLACVGAGAVAYLRQVKA
jgi:hypothetical protein